MYFFPDRNDSSFICKVTPLILSRLIQWKTPRLINKSMIVFLTNRIMWIISTVFVFPLHFLFSHPSVIWYPKRGHFNTRLQPFPLYANWPKSPLYNYRSTQGDILAADWPRGGLPHIWGMTCLLLPQSSCMWLIYLKEFAAYLGVKNESMKSGLHS